MCNLWLMKEVEVLVILEVENMLGSVVEAEADKGCGT